MTIDENGTPDWVKGLIMAELRILTATPEGTLKSAIKLLDHYQEMGVNGLWICPINDPGPIEENSYKNTYSNLGIHTIDPNITGETDYDKGRKALKEFIEKAHNRNIRIIIDIISWGTVLGAPLKEEHPDWYVEGIRWGGDGFDWENEEFVKWYKKELIDFALETGCDGFRYDCEPGFAGASFHKEIREQLLARGRKLFMMGEHQNERSGAYDIDQYAIYCTDAVNPLPFINSLNIVDAVKTGNIGSPASIQNGEGGMYRYYTSCVSNHDFKNPGVNNNKLAISYQAIFSPFIPLWYIGDEWNNPHQSLCDVDDAMYFNKIDWEEFEKPINQRFFEDVKDMIRVRRENKEIFEYFPKYFKDTNICKVDTEYGDIQAYALYYGNTAIVVVPNNTNGRARNKAKLDLKAMELDNYSSYIVSNPFNGEIIMQGAAEGIIKIEIETDEKAVSLLKIQGLN